MKLGKIEDCSRTLQNLFETKELDFDIAGSLCDLLIFIESQCDKYNRLRNKLIGEYFVASKTESGIYDIKDTSKLEIANEELNKLNDIPVEFDKKYLSKFDGIKAKELYYLKEFFIFE